MPISTRILSFLKRTVSQPSAGRTITSKYPRIYIHLSYYATFAPIQFLIMLPWTALLCVAVILKGVSTLPTDVSSTTSAGGVDNPTATLSSHDSPSAIFAFYDSCPTDSPNAKSKGGAVWEYKPGDCQEVNETGNIMMINWKVGGFWTLMTYEDKACNIILDIFNAPMQIQDFESGDTVETCVDFSLEPSKRGHKVMSVQSGIGVGGKREIHPSAATLSSREILHSDNMLHMRQDTYGDAGNPGSFVAAVPTPSATPVPSAQPKAIGFWDHCPNDLNGNKIDANQTGADVEGYKVGACQEINPSGPTMSIHYKEGGFDGIVVYQDKNCTEEVAVYDRGKTTWKDVRCVELENIPKVLSFIGVKVKSRERGWDTLESGSS